MRNRSLSGLLAALAYLGPNLLYHPGIRLEDMKVGADAQPTFPVGHGGRHSTRAGSMSVGARIRASQNGSWAMNSYHAQRAAQQAELYADTPAHPVTRQMRRHFGGRHV